VGVSFIPPQNKLERESIRGREVESQLKAAQYAHLHPETDYPTRKQQHRLLQRLRGMLSRKHDSD
jgi:hypothetical protein